MVSNFSNISSHSRKNKVIYLGFIFLITLSMQGCSWFSSCSSNDYELKLSEPLNQWFKVVCDDENGQYFTTKGQLSLNNTAGQEVVISPYGEPFPKQSISYTDYRFIKIHDYKYLASYQIENMNDLLKKTIGEEFFYKDIYKIRLGADRGMHGYYWDLIVFVNEKPDYIYACLNNCHTDYREVFTIR